jgi:hypothetical protein
VDPKFLGVATQPPPRPHAASPLRLTASCLTIPQAGLPATKFRRRAGYPMIPYFQAHRSGGKVVERPRANMTNAVSLRVSKFPVSSSPVPELHW